VLQRVAVCIAVGCSVYLQSVFEDACHILHTHTRWVVLQCVLQRVLQYVLQRLLQCVEECDAVFVAECCRTLQ